MRRKGCAIQLPQLQIATPTCREGLVFARLFVFTTGFAAKCTEGQRRSQALRDILPHASLRSRLALDHAAFKWNHLNAANVIHFNNLEHAFCEKPFSTFSQHALGNTAMIELLRTNDLVLISAVEALLAERGIGVFIADQFMSAMEGSIGFLPRRILIRADDAAPARQALVQAGLAQELPDA
jgi:Putative prokaryotic signal transducing protein